MMTHSQRRIRRFSFVVSTGLLLAAMTQAGAHGQGQPTPQITVTPDAGLVDGQTVMVSGTGFQPDQDVQLVECGAEMMTPPFIGATCSFYSVGTHTDAEGNFGPVSFTVTTSIDGRRWTKGHYVPATHDCAPASDCYVHAFSMSRGLRSANQHLSFE